MHSLTRSLTLLAFAATLAACKGSSSNSTPGTAVNPVKVHEIDLGRTLAADKSIADKTETFRPADTIYVAVKTTGSAESATLAARWRYGDQPVTESTRTIAPRGDEVTEFHASKPDGWPTGSYEVEILLNGVSAGKESFKVQ